MSNDSPNALGRTTVGNIRRIKELRAEKCWTQEKLAENADVSKRTIENAEVGKPVRLSNLKLIADAFGVNVGELIDLRSVDKNITDSHPAITAVPDFTGRTQELADIATNLRSGTTVCIAAIKAAGGMGKTQLARKSAEDLASQFPDGTYLLELDGMTEPKTSVAVMKELIAKCIPGPCIGSAIPALNQ